jgi:hypothetical protein
MLLIIQGEIYFFHIKHRKVQKAEMKFSTGYEDHLKGNTITTVTSVSRVLQSEHY